MGNYEKFLNIIANWPYTPDAKAYNYGYYLRQLLKCKDTQGDIFPGNTAENSKKLNSLWRLVNNTYGFKYPNNKEIGASGLSRKQLKF